ncbi:unnamed protein product [Caenorhabditis brenneri]
MRSLMNVSNFLRVAMPTRTHLLSIFRNPNLRHYSDGLSDHSSTLPSQNQPKKTMNVPSFFWEAKPSWNNWVERVTIFKEPNLKLKLLGLHYSDLRESERINEQLQKFSRNKKIHVEKLVIAPNSQSTIDLNILMAIQYLDPDALQKIFIVDDVKNIRDSRKVLEKLVGLEQFQRISTIGYSEKMGVIPQPLAPFLKSPPVFSKFLGTGLPVNGMRPNCFARVIKFIMDRRADLEGFHYFRPDNHFPVTLPNHFTEPEFFKMKGIPANNLPLNMPESLKNDDKSIRSYILNDVLEKVPIDKSFKNLCKVIGKDAIAFYDFQFWYYRFLGGKQDLEFDRSSEPEPLQFSDLPVDAVGLIVDKLKVEERLMLRRVSKSLQEFIEKQVFDCTSIGVSFGDDLIHVSYGNEEILYAKNDEAVKYYEETYGVCAARILYRNESEICDDLACVLKNPKLQLYDFDFSYMLSCVEDDVLSKFFYKLKFVLKSLKHQIAVRKLYIRPEHPDNVLAILPYLKPGYLEEITINNKVGFYDWKSNKNIRKVEQIMQLDQWKQAEKLSLLDSLHRFPDEVFLQFKRYMIHPRTLDQSQLARIRMMFATSPVFEYCRFIVENLSWEFDFMDSIGVPGPPDEDYRSIGHYMIPKTDKMLVFKEFEYGVFEIEKKTQDDAQ